MALENVVKKNKATPQKVGEDRKKSPNLCGVAIFINRICKMLFLFTTK